MVVGAYPEGQEDWDLSWADNPADYVRAHEEIGRVKLPAFDPVTGQRGPLLDLWHVRGAPGA